MRRQGRRGLTPQGVALHNLHYVSRQIVRAPGVPRRSKGNRGEGGERGYLSGPPGGGRGLSSEASAKEDMGGRGRGAVLFHPRVNTANKLSEARLHAHGRGTVNRDGDR